MHILQGGSIMNKAIKKTALIALFAAVSFAVFSYGRIDIPLAAGSKVSIHVANAVVVLCALLLGPVEGGLAGAIGLSFADILDPVYIVSAPKTFFCKFMIGLISGLVGHKLFNISKIEDKKKLTVAAFVSSIAGLGFNVIFDPLIGYVFKRYILQIGEVSANFILAWTSGVTLFNAVICVFIASLLYMALRKPFNRYTK